jgi:EmrB/QacA subfamily drug resistance transporter
MSLETGPGLSRQKHQTDEKETTMTDTTAERRHWIALYVLCTGMLMIVLDMTIVNVALPSIQSDLGFSQASLAWVVNAYLISYGGLLLLAGRLGDLIGPRRVFLVGLAIFTAASALCAVSQGEAMLVSARFIQGVGGAFTSAVILGMIVRMFPPGREQAKAMGVFGFVASAGGSIGLLAGGILTQAISWHWIFFINLPIGVVVAVLARRYVDETPGLGIRQGADALGAVLLTASLMLGVYTILGVSEHGWGSSHTLGLFAVSLALGVAFLVRQARIEQPLVPLRIFRSPNIAAANAVQALLVAGMFGMFFMGALYLQRVLGYDALQVGLAFLPATIVMGTLSLKVSERVSMRYGPLAALLPSLVGILTGLLLLARTPVDGTYVKDMLVPMMLVGSAGLGFPALMMLTMSGVAPEDSGLASGLVNTSLQVGGAIGLAVLATLSSQRTSDLLASGTAHDTALNSGYHLAYMIGAGLVAISIVIAAAKLRPVPMPEQSGAHGTEFATAEA